MRENFSPLNRTLSASYSAPVAASTASMRGQVGRGVELPEDAAAGVHLDASDRAAVLHEPQLLEALPALEPALGPVGIGEQGLAAIGIDANVMENRDLFALGERPAGEGQHLLGEVEGAARRRRRPRSWRPPGPPGDPRGTPPAPRRRSAGPGSRPRVAGCAMAAISASTNHGGVSGASPCTLTTTSNSGPSSSATAAQRSVPLRQVAGVITTSAPKPSAAAAMRASSVATTRRSTPATAWAASQVRWIRVRATPVGAAQLDQRLARIAGRGIARGDDQEDGHGLRPATSATPGAKAMKNGFSNPGLP